MSCNPPLLRDDLWLAAHPAHDAIHRSGLVGRLTSRKVARQDYCEFLLCMRTALSFLQPSADRLHKKASLPSDYCLQLRVDWLEEDLTNLSCHDQSSPRFDAPVPVSVGEYWGIAYLMEGSAQGGKWLSRHLGERLGVSKVMGGRFVYGFGESSKRRWEEFTRLLNRAGRDPAIRDQAKDAVDSTLWAFARLFERVRHAHKKTA